MSETQPREAVVDGDDEQATERIEDLRAQVDLLRSENERLRHEYARARQASYRRTALGLGAVGAVAVAGGLVFPAAREVLFVLGAIGVFGAVLTRYLTPERFVAAETGERIYAAQADSLGDLTGQLGLEPTWVYVPVEGEPPARLFVPQHSEYEIPDEAALERPLVVGDRDAERGASFVPTGGTLFREFERSLTGSLGTAPRPIAEQVADALIEGFELAETAEVAVDGDAGRVTVALTGAVYADAEAVDNPLGSLLAVALADGLDQPVRLETTRSDDDLVLTCRWDMDEGEEETDETAATGTVETDGEEPDS
ncbi:hypothetical protein [Halolamina rubra]|uniref:hypothetical protein n=1 Tax=Halolamina rubra TaxID=1380430 RepID=UPI000679379B|nr:hypothetical protein [Halolamina rubra]